MTDSVVNVNCREVKDQGIATYVSNASIDTTIIATGLIHALEKEINAPSLLSFLCCPYTCYS